MALSLSSLNTSLQSWLPERAGKALQRRLLRSLGKPAVYLDPLQHPPGGLGRGSVTFSLDFELAWAWRYSKRGGREARAIGLRERAQLPGILAEFDRRGLPATWAVVGHLFLDACRRAGNGRAHPEVPPVAPFETRWWKFEGPDWFEHDPCTDLRRDPAWYAPDLIAMIQVSPVHHEIACHSFSHMSFGPECPHETALAELRACRAAMAAAGVEETSSFVHPGNGLGNLAALKEAGFTIFRAFPWEKGEISLPVRLPEGLWLVPSAMCLECGDATDPRRMRAHRRRLELLADIAAETGLNAHFWLHPSIPVPQIEHLLSPFLDYCARLRESRSLDILTMRELVARTVALAPLPQEARGGGK